MNSGARRRTRTSPTAPKRRESSTKLGRCDILAVMRLGLLTGGGDCPGLNAVIRAVVRTGIREHGDTFVGFKDGWRGPLEKDYKEMGLEDISGILNIGGTILGSSRTNPFKEDGNAALLVDNFEALGLDGLIAIGGEDTLGVAERLNREFNVPVIGCPKTIDNDLSGTDRTFGFDTAVQIATDAIDRLHSTACSHHRNMVVEIMGRHAGHLALHSGVAGGADVILIPEEPFDIDEVCAKVNERHAEGQPGFAIVVVSEGATPKDGTLALYDKGLDAFGHVRLGGVGQLLEREIEERTGYETRCTVLGHLQRGGTPSAFDRVLATRVGLKAIEAAHAGLWGT